ncbi:hypothetical protein DFH11DRAFT_1547003 [Phellopilus nigrolimitatus]|nr:hypothetical protein DFH11DRAFT_1547003 [Phellopilus nigrolimitatus]
MANLQPTRGLPNPPSIRTKSPSRVVTDIPTAVNNLLDTMRRLEASLRQWGSLEITEVEVSEEFVTFGNCFHEMLAAFAAYNINMRCAPPVLVSYPIAARSSQPRILLYCFPSAGTCLAFSTELRGVLEECLSEDPTPQNISYLQPQVRKIIASLLTSLRDKQPIYWEAKRARHTHLDSTDHLLVN